MLTNSWIGQKGKKILKEAWSIELFGQALIGDFGINAEYTYLLVALGAWVFNTV